MPWGSLAVLLKIVLPTPMPFKNTSCDCLTRCMNMVKDPLVQFFFNKFKISGCGGWQVDLLSNCKMAAKYPDIILTFIETQLR